VLTSRARRGAPPSDRAAGAALRLLAAVADFFFANCGWRRALELGPRARAARRRSALSASAA